VTSEFQVALTRPTAEPAEDDLGEHCNSFKILKNCLPKEGAQMSPLILILILLLLFGGGGGYYAYGPYGGIGIGGIILIILVVLLLSGRFRT
jgi:hypothetical protein